jgi:nicotinamide riboside kinase
MDDLRDRPNDRQKMFCTFESQLKEYKLQYEILKGSQSERFEFAVEKILELFKEI